MKKLTMAIMMVAIVAAVPAFAGEWHAGQTNVCTDCHTMHFSQQHDWNSAAAPSTATAANGNWLSTSGPNEYLLKAPVNQLCLGCHDGQTFAPDVLTTDSSGATYAQGRSAGALNDLTSGAPYEGYKGHTLGSTNAPPGYVGTFYTGTTDGLECISCHSQHGSATAYRNLGPYSIPGVQRPSYVISTTNDTTKDVWINIPAGYKANQGSANFSPYYDNANVSYNRNDKTASPVTGAPAVMQSNTMDAFCGACHGNFHGGTGNANIGGGTAGALADGFIRHPTSGQTIGAATAGGHSSLTRYAAAGATTKVKVYSSVAALTDAAPGCVSCHKAHGNQNPFGLIFLARAATSVGEQGGYGSTQVEMPNGYGVGYRNLCGQCHSQGADSTSTTTPN